jgi:hypothetical protein
MYLRFIPLTDGDEGLEKVVQITQEEWDLLIAPALADGHPVDGSTVDSALCDKLYGRRAVRGKMWDFELLMV